MRQEGSDRHFMARKEKQAQRISELGHQRAGLVVGVLNLLKRERTPGASVPLTPANGH